MADCGDGHPSSADLARRGRLLRVWVRLFRALDLDPPAPPFLDLLAAYQQPHRHYHTLEHLDECLAGLEQVWDQLSDPATVAWALFFHDSVYDPLAQDNERNSAMQAYLQGRRWGLGEDRARRAAWLVLLTQGHTLAMDVPDGAWMLDLDLGILGSDPARFARYEAQIRAEYAAVPEARYRAGRAAVLSRFLTDGPIYHTAWGRAREAQAQVNVSQALAQLQGVPAPRSAPALGAAR